LITLNIASAAYAEEVKGNIVEERYSTVLSKWLQNGIKDTEGINIEIDPAQFSLQSDNKLVDENNSKGYKSAAAHLQKEQALEFNVNAPKEGLYNVSLDYFILSDGLMSNEAACKSTEPISIMRLEE
jgi:hypothetical protein